IGSHLSERLVRSGRRVIGLDNFADFYPRAAKERNLAAIDAADAGDTFTFIEGDIRDAALVGELMASHAPDAIIHIAAMAGVRPSIENPRLYSEVNVDGTVTLLDAAAGAGVRSFVFASSSSVYGNNDTVPFAETHDVNEPISPYAATKRAGELLCHAHWSLHRLPIACLRFFTVYGPRQRPDLAIMKFMRMIAAGEPIPVFGDGSTSRDYTYIDDIIDGVVAALERADRFRIYNLGGNRPVSLSDLIAAIETTMAMPANIRRLPLQPGDVQRTFADLTRSGAELDYHPRTTLEEGLARQWAWVRGHP
ncbi:MAG: GDP-mannose 4,6-dehydratase, partial [Phycisphaerales bacterium]|nr:GDP-mannose 4,6-dehydratase [Phycisphaerales bacterium]